MGGERRERTGARDGPTGNVGRAVVRALLAEGVPVRAAVKSSELTAALLKEMDGRA